MKRTLKRIEYALKVVLYKGLLVRLFHNPPITKPLDPKQVRRILVLRRDMIGDMIITSWLFRALHDLNPQIKIDVIASTRGASVIHHNPRICTVWTLQGGWRSLIDTILKARQYTYDAVICLSIHGLTTDGLIANLIAPNALKLTIKQPKKHNLYQILFNKEVETHYLYEPLWRSQKAVLDALFGIDYPVEAIRQELYPPEHAQQAVAQFLREHRLEREEYIVLNISARIQLRQWGKENFIAYLKMLTNHYPDINIVITAMPDDRPSAMQIIQAVQSSRLYLMPAEFGLDEVMVLIRYAKLLVSPDTANVHIAATFQVPVVALYTLLEANIMWLPLNTIYEAIYTDKPESISHIPPARVFERTCDLLNRLVANSTVTKSNY